MVVWCTQNTPTRQQFHVAPAMPALQVHHFDGFLKTRYEKLITHVESHASAVSLFETGEQRYIKAIITVLRIQLLTTNSNGLSQKTLQIYN